MAKRSRKKLSGPEKVRRFTMICMLLVGVGCLSYFTYYCYQAKHHTNETARLTELKEKNIMINPERFITRAEDPDAPPILSEYESLYLKNKSLIGWLKIDDTNIDYPVMQSQNEEYYLDHDYEQNYDKNGALFISADARIWPRSQNIIVFGHNMKSGKMFGNLSKYKKKSYYEKHKTIQFDTLYEKGTYQVMFAFTEKVYDVDEVAFKYYQFIDAYSEEEYNSYMEEMKRKSLYETQVSTQYTDSLLTLSTCDHDTPDAERFVVVAKKIR